MTTRKHARARAKSVEAQPHAWWNHRVINDGASLAIHEVYYKRSARGVTKFNGWTGKPTYVAVDADEGVDALVTELGLLARACQLPVLRVVKRGGREYLQQSRTTARKGAGKGRA